MLIRTASAKLSAETDICTPLVDMAPNTSTKDAPVTGVSSAKTSKYSWEEVAKHNSSESCWVYFEDGVYDITPWLERHPGGKQMLLLSAGRDITDMLDCYHPFTSKPREILEKFRIGTISKTEFPRYKPDTGFYKEVREKVGEYFEKTGNDPKDPLPGLMRLALIFTVAYYSFLIAYDSSYSWFVRIISAQIFGICQALPLLHCMHDASHTSIGHSPYMWASIGRLTMDWFAGASLTSWHNQHVVGHHVYTNVLGADPDLPVTRQGDPRRVTKLQYWAWVYKFQHVYLFILYGVLAIKFRMQDLSQLITHTNGPVRVNIHGYSEHIWAFLTKAFWFSWRVLVPLVVWKVPFFTYWALFLVMDLMTGFWLAYNFQVSHISPSCIWPDMDIADKGFEEEWAVSQVKTTVDYAHGNFLFTFLSGALNYQVVHHLFPGVSQYHYPAIAPIVMDVCKKYKVPYVHLPTFYEAIKCHFLYLRDMGLKDAH